MADYRVLTLTADQYCFSPAPVRHFPCVLQRLAFYAPPSDFVVCSWFANFVAEAFSNLMVAATESVGVQRACIMRGKKSSAFVLEGLRDEYSIARLCRRENIAQRLYYRWS